MTELWAHALTWAEVDPLRHPFGKPIEPARDLAFGHTGPALGIQLRELSVVQVAGGVGVLSRGQLVLMAEEASQKDRRTRAWDEGAIDIEELGTRMIG